MTVTAILPVPMTLAARREAVFAPVAGESPLARIVRSLASVADVIVAAAVPLVGEVSETLAHQRLSAQVCSVEDPATRAGCIAAALGALEDGGPVLVHDIAWPLVSAAALDRVVAALRDGAAAALPVCPVTDSIKAVDSKGAVTATVERSPLRTIQYPRGFDADVLSRLVTGDATDDLDAALAAGVPVTPVDGDTDTMAVELPADASYLAAVIEGRSDRPDR